MAMEYLFLFMENIYKKVHRIRMMVMAELVMTLIGVVTYRSYNHHKHVRHV